MKSRALRRPQAIITSCKERIPLRSISKRWLALGFSKERGGPWDPEELEKWDPQGVRKGKDQDPETLQGMDE